MLALTLHQYWAHAMAPLLIKKIETRGWYTPYRGKLAIHAAASVPAYAKDDFEANAVAGRVFEPLDIYTGDDLKKLPLGAIVGVCDLVACIETKRPYRPENIQRGWIPPAPDTFEYAFGNFDPGRFMWITENMQALKEPIPCRGYQKLWTVPKDIEARIHAQLASEENSSPVEEERERLTPGKCPECGYQLEVEWYAPEHDPENESRVIKCWGCGFWENVVE